MNSEDPRLDALREAVSSLTAAAQDDPAVAERALRRLKADPKLSKHIVMPSGMKRTGRRPPAKFDPIRLADEAGMPGLEEALGDLDLEDLRNIVAQYGMDPRRLVMKWKDADRVRAHIVATVTQRSRKGGAFRTPESGMLTDRQRALMKAFVFAWESDSPGPAHQPFDFGSYPLEHLNWPSATRVPDQEEVRPLVHLGLLEVDRRAAPVWRVFPAARARDEFSNAPSPETAALSDVDIRLGVILDAAIAAFEADPSQTMHLAVLDQVDYVTHPRWPIAPDLVRQHDLEQLEEVGLLSLRREGEGLTFWPTAAARAAARDVIGYLDERAGEASTSEERSRMKQWALWLRAGDIAVGTAGATSAALIRALAGF